MCPRLLMLNLTPQRLKIHVLRRYKDLLSFLSAKDFLLIVITNQPDIGNELVKLEEVEKMHNLLCESLPVTESWFVLIVN